MEDKLKEAALRHLEKNIVTWLRENSYQKLLEKAKEHTEDSDGHEIIIDENNVKYVLEDAKLYCSYCIIAKKKLVAIDDLKLPEKSDLHELY